MNRFHPYASQAGGTSVPFAGFRGMVVSPGPARPLPPGPPPQAAMMMARSVQTFNAGAYRRVDKGRKDGGREWEYPHRAPRPPGPPPQMTPEKMMMQANR